MKRLAYILCLVLIFIEPGLSQNLHYRYAFAIEGENLSYSRKIAAFDDGSYVGFFHPLPWGTDTCDFDPGPGQQLYNGLTQKGALLVRYSADGSFLWMRDIASSASPTAFEEAVDIAVDLQGNIYLFGLFSDSLDFDPGPGKRMLNTKSIQNFSANQAAYIVKYDKDGQFLDAFSIIGLSEFNDAFLKPRVIRIGPDNQLYLCGQVLGNADFDPGPQIATTPDGKVAIGGTIFVASYDLDLNFRKLHIIGVKNTLTSGGGIEPADMAIAPDGAIYLCGILRMGGDRDYDPGEREIRLTAKGIDDAVLLKYSADGNYLWGGVFGSNDFENTLAELPVSMQTDSEGNVYLAGTCLHSYDADLIPDDGVSVPVDRPGDFIVKYTHSGNVAWAKSYTHCQGSIYNFGRVYNMVLTPDRLILCGSYSCENDFDPDSTKQNIQSHLLGDDIYVLYCDTSGNLTGVTTFKGTGDEHAGTVLKNPSNEITLFGALRTYLPGGTSPSKSVIDLNPGQEVNEFSNTSLTTGSWFIARFGEVPGAIWDLTARNKGAYKVLRATDGILEIQFSGKEAKPKRAGIFDITGRMLMNQSFKPGQNGTLTLEGLPAGLILLSVPDSEYPAIPVWMN